MLHSQQNAHCLLLHCFACDPPVERLGLDWAFPTESFSEGGSLGHNKYVLVKLLNVQKLGDLSNFDVFLLHRSMMSIREAGAWLSGKLPEVYPVEYGSKVPCGKGPSSLISGCLN